MLKIDKVSKSYGKSNLKAVDAVSFEVARGEIYGFLGPNGAGKTTMIKMIVGLLRPDEGTIFADGTDVWKSPIEGKRILTTFPITRKFIPN